MPILFSNEIRYFKFDLFDPKVVNQGIFCRVGGISSEPWRSLNLGGTNGDSRANVIENRKRIFDVMDRKVESIFDVWQVHGTDVICPDLPRPLNESHQQADVILTDKPEITLFMRFADCVPIFLYEPKKHVIGIVHAGWQGTVKNAVKIAVQKMITKFGCVASDIQAGIGPSIGPDHYEVGLEVIRKARKAFRNDVDDVLITVNGKTHFNLWKANQLNLIREGVVSIETSEICTACGTEDWYSHRAENGKTGRFGALLALNN